MCRCQVPLAEKLHDIKWNTWKTYETCDTWFRNSSCWTKCNQVKQVSHENVPKPHLIRVSLECFSCVPHAFHMQFLHVIACVKWMRLFYERPVCIHSIKWCSLYTCMLLNSCTVKKKVYFVSKAFTFSFYIMKWSCCSSLVESLMLCKRWALNPNHSSTGLRRWFMLSSTQK